jgi:hypothetical protein
MAPPRSHLVYAVAPDGMSAREANDLLNASIGTPERGLPVFHVHWSRDGYTHVYWEDDQPLEDFGGSVVPNGKLRRAPSAGPERP